MNAKTLSFAFLVAFMALSALAAQSPEILAPQFRAVGVQDARAKDAQPDKGKDKQPDKGKKEEKKLTEPSPFDFLAQAPAPVGDVSSGFRPHMMGDFGFKFAKQNFTVFGTLTTTVATPGSVSPGFVPASSTTTTTTITQTRTLYVPIPTAGGFKVAENASPRPLDRVFATYNYFGDIRNSANGSTQPSSLVTTSSSQSTDSSTGATFNTTTNTQFLIPGAPFANLHRETFGFEKTFLDGFASIELRLPLLQLYGSGQAFGSENVGDLTIIGKYAFLLDPDSGDVVSGGLAITAPTGPGIVTTEGTMRSTLLQPWFGYIWNFERFYVQGFHSLVVPTDNRDVTLLFNDLGLNWWLFTRDDPSAVVNFIVPTAEVHITTPLNNRGGTDVLTAYDQVVMTGGVHVGLFRNSMLTFGAATPVTGPRLFSVEGFVQYNRRF